ncbi:MAG TPA: MFS transporter [Caulobacteraceae bacterium]|jgi:PPP family 3-phenylpropionic acid transporter
MSTPWRLGLFYGLMFLANGASLPYLPVWLRAQGLGGAAIGAILAAPYLARVVTGPAAAVWADGFHQRRTSLMLLAAAGAFAGAALLLTRGAGAHALAWFVASSALMAMLPLMDVLGLRLSQREGFVYGRPRSGGSAAFIVANLAMGALLTRGSPDLVVVWFAASMAVCALCARLLPPEPIHEEGAPPLERRERWRGLKDLLTSPTFMLAIVTIGLIQGAHGFQYGFSALVWKGQGISEAVIGALWATGVAAEIVFLWFLPRDRVGPLGLMLIGGLASLIRWTLMAFGPPAAVLFPLQILHALTFAATFVGGLRLVQRLCPPESVTAAQTLNASLSGGLFIGLASLASGALFDAYGAGGYLAMTAMSLAGLVGLALLQRSLARADAAVT